MNVRKPDSSDLLEDAIRGALAETLPADLAREGSTKSAPPVTSPAAAPLPAPAPTPIPPVATTPLAQTVGLLGAPPKPPTKSASRRKIGPYITFDTGDRMDMALLRLKRMGSKNDISDLVEVALIKILDMLEAGLDGDQKPDAFDLLDDCKKFLKEVLPMGVLPPNMHGRAEAIISQIESLDT